MARRAAASKTHADPHNRSVKARVFQFLMPFAAAPLVFVALLLLRASVADNVPVLVLYAAAAVLAGGGFLLWVWHLSAHRDLPVRLMLAATVGFAALGAVITLAVGGAVWWARTYITVGELMAGFWSVSRIDALRKDSRGDDESGDDDSKLRSELGLEGVKFKPAKAIRDESGKIVRIEVKAKNKPGGTAKQIQEAVPGLESLAGDAFGPGVPIGRSRAVPNGPSETNIVIITEDVLKDMLPYPGPSAFGKPITVPLHIGTWEDQVPETIKIAGGHDDAPTPVSSGWMGMTRTGKTAGAHVEKLEISSRSNAALIWFDSVKGAQTAEPLADVFALMVATDDQKTLRTGVSRLKNVIKARTDLLGKHGFRSWTDEASFKLGLPFLDVQLEEADDLLQDPQAADDAVFIASKGLSAGVRINVSLQRMDANSAPTGLRYNLGLNRVYGVGDDYSAAFLLTPPTIDAGAHPEYWKQSKPGYHYIEGLSVPDERAPIPAKSFFADNDTMRELGALFAEHMMPLHPVDIAALNGTDGWFDFMADQMMQQIDEWRANLPAGGGRVVTDGVAPAVPAARRAPSARSHEERDDTPMTSGYDDDYDSAEQIREEVDSVHEDDHFPREVYDDVDPETHRIDPSVTTPAVARAAEGMTWGEDKPEPKSREDAIEALHKALVEIFERPVNEPDAEDDEFIRREDEHTVSFGPGAIARRYPFRSRPWFSSTLKDMVRGAVSMPPGMSIEAPEPGVYVMRRELEHATHGGHR